MALQFPKLQTIIAQRAVNALESRINGNLEIGRISIVFFNKVIAYDVSITGAPGDTLASFEKLSVSIFPGELLRGNIHLDRLLLENGCFNLIKEGPGKYSNLNRIFGYDPKPDSLKKPVRLPDITINELTLRGMRFALCNPAMDTAAHIKGKMNFKDLHVSGINARFSRVRIQDNVISSRIRELSAVEQCGYELRSLSGEFSLNRERAAIEDLHLTDAYSDIRAGYLSFGYSSGKDLHDFVHKITLGADFDHAVLDFRSIGYFATALQGNTTRLNITGEVTGPVCRLRTDNLTATSGDSTTINVRAAITGLPDISETLFDIGVKNISTVSPELSGIVAAFSRKPNSLHSIMPDTRISLTGEILGTFSDISSHGTLSSAEGSISYTAGLTRDSSTTGSTGISSSLQTKRLNMGKILGNSLFGNLDLSAGLHATFNKAANGGISADIDSLRISRMTIKGYEYRDIAVNGELKNHTANVRLISHDNALPTMFQSIINLDSTNSPERIRLYLDVPYADLKTMNLVETGSISNLGITAGADLRLTDKSILGNVLLDNINYANDNGQYHIDSLYIRSAIMENKNIVTVKSPIFHADYSGTGTPVRLVENIKTAIRGEALKDVIQADTSSSEKGRYDFHLRTFDMSQICDIILPGLYIADSTTVNMSLDTSNRLDLKLQSSSVSFAVKSGKAFSFKDITLSAGNSGGNTASLLSIGNITSGNTFLNNVRIFAGDNAGTLRTSVSYNNADTTYMNLSAGLKFSRDGKGKLTTGIALDNSEINIRGHRWQIAPANIIIADKYYSISGFELAGATDRLSIAGTVSENPEDKVTLTADNVDLSVLNSFTPDGLNLRGSLNGEVNLYNFFSDKGISMEIEGSDLSIFGKDLGTLKILSRRDAARDRFNILVNNYVEGNNPINVSGYYIPGRNFMNLNLTLKKLQLSYLTPMLSDVLTIDKGSLNGEITVSGQPDRLVILSNNSYIDSLYLTPAFTKVTYLIDGPVSMTQRGFEINRLNISDPYGATAVLQGNITHNSFRNMYLDAGLTFNNLLCLNTRAHDNSSFYGTAYASGNISLSGYTDNLLIDAQIATNDNTSIHIPLSSASSATATDLISYTDFRVTDDPEKVQDDTDNEEGTVKRHGSNLEIRAMASINQGAELLVEMNKQFGGTLRCSGNGEMELNFNPSRNITDLRGDYTVADGSYHLTLSAIQSRDFILDEGGTITFNGDLKNTSLNVGATYKTKASISTLISDTTSVGNRRNVNCGIQLQGSLSNPEISFSIDIPDLDPITKGMVESALSTPDKILKQVMALLISGSFVPDEQSGIVNNSTILYSNASEILSNQFNNIFRQLDIPLDLGLNYQPGTATGGKDMFDVAISYQAFNNRLIINGNLGNSETSSNWAGDFEAEIKVDRQGKLRVTLFTRSADSYSNYLDNTQRSGFGITYQDEFDTFGDFLRNIFFSRKRKEEYELQLMKEAEEELEREAAEANIKKETVMKPKEDPMNLTEDTGYIEYQGE